MNMTVFQEIVPYSLVEIYRRFRGAIFITRAMMMDAIRTSQTSVSFYGIRSSKIVIFRMQRSVLSRQRNREANLHVMVGVGLSVERPAHAL
jgi:hypothetical protein